jgi:hypothetical protein
MKKHFGLGVAAACIGLSLAISGCSGSGPGSSVSPAQVPANADVVTPTALVAGQYTGTATDSARGKASAALNLTASGLASGGGMTLAYGRKNVRAVVALSASGTTLNGNETVLTATPCSFSMQASYDPKKHVLSGTYSAITGCSGHKGKFKLVEQCYFPIPSVTNDVMRPNVLGIRPC